jgi:hypothetical protein
MKTQTNLSNYSIDGWDEVFNEVTLRGLPLIYVNAILINFKNGTSWEIDIPSKYRNKSTDEIDEILDQFCSSHAEHIYDVDMQIDTKKVRKAVEKAVKKLII